MISPNLTQTIELAGKSAPKLDALKKATKEIEAVFTKQLLTEMEKSLPKSPFGEAAGSDIYQDFFNQAISQNASKSGSLGIANMLFRQLSPRVIGEARAELIQEGLAANQPSTTKIQK